MADLIEQTSNGGQYYATGAAATLTSIAGPYRACKILVLTSGSAVTSFYDNATAISGTEVFRIPATPTVGTIYDIQLPLTAGLSWGTTNTSAVVVTYDKLGVNGVG